MKIICLIFAVLFFVGCNDPAVDDDDPPQIIIYNDAGRTLIIEYSLTPYIEISGAIPNQGEYEVENGVDVVFLSVEKWVNYDECCN